MRFEEQAPLVAANGSVPKRTYLFQLFQTFQLLQPPPLPPPRRTGEEEGGGALLLGLTFCLGFSSLCE